MINNTGAASNKVQQTMLKFTTGQHDNLLQDPSTSDGTNNQDANAQQEILQNRAKRGRTDFEGITEDPNSMCTDDGTGVGRLPIPEPVPQSESDSSWCTAEGLFNLINNNQSVSISSIR